MPLYINVCIQRKSLCYPMNVKRRYLTGQEVSGQGREEKTIYGDEEALCERRDLKFKKVRWGRKKKKEQI